MGSLNNVFSTITPLLSTIGGIPGGAIALGRQAMGNIQSASDFEAQQRAAMEQLQAQQRLSEDQAVADANLQKAQIAADAQTAEARRSSALRRAVARQKILFSSQGLGAMDGSNEAVLLGLYNESEDDARAQVKSDALRTAALEQNIQKMRQRNLLAATQLAQNQRIDHALLNY